MWLRKKADDEAYSAYLRNVKVANPGIHGHHHEPEISGITVKHYAEGAASNPDERRRKAWAQRELVKLRQAYEAQKAQVPSVEKIHKLRQAYEAQKAQVPSVEKIQEAIKAGPKEGTPLHELAVKLRSSPELVLQTLLSSELMATGEVHFDPSTASLAFDRESCRLVPQKSKRTWGLSQNPCSSNLDCTQSSDSTRFEIIPHVLGKPFFRY
jgi:hypothetical protein